MSSKRVFIRLRSPIGAHFLFLMGRFSMNAIKAAEKREIFSAVRFSPAAASPAVVRLPAVWQTGFHWRGARHHLSSMGMHPALRIGQESTPGAGPEYYLLSAPNAVQPLTKVRKVRLA